jgi:hemolysin activation/secretion protein
VSLDDSVLPVKGITVRANGMYVKNITEPDFFQQYDARIQSYLPLTKKFSLMLRAGGATIVGPASILNNALPIQHAVIGGPDNLRGYAFDRFWGRTSFYNNNEIRFITNLRSYILNAKIGVFGFFDDGRVWISNESSNTMHTSYGGGILLSPFHFLSCTLTYGISSESKLVQFKINTLF